MRERERSRGRESKRGGQRRGRSPLDPESANSNITIRPPGSERRRTLRLPPSSYVLSLSLFCVSLSLSLSPWHLILSYHRALVSCHLGPLPLFSTRLHDPTPTNLLLLLLSSTFPSRSHFRFNVGQLSRRAAGCANAADKRVFTRCR